MERIGRVGDGTYRRHSRGGAWPSPAMLRHSPSVREPPPAKVIEEGAYWGHKSITVFAVFAG